MTPEAQRIAIAEACGAKIIRKRMIGYGHNRYGEKWAWNGNEKTPCAHAAGGRFGWGWNEIAFINELPDYLNDLNAMNEAEKVLNYSQRRDYCARLFNLPTSECESNAFATAAQRAEALLKTIGKWEA